MNHELLTATLPAEVPHAVIALEDALNARGIDVFAVIDHAAGARNVGLQLDDEVVVIFGNPTVGTRLMQEDRAVGLELPLRMLFWREGDQTHVAYSDPHGLKERFNLDQSAPALDGMASLLSGLVAELQRATA